MEKLEDLGRGSQPACDVRRTSSPAIVCVCKAEAETELTKLMLSDTNSGATHVRGKQRNTVIAESVGVEELVADTQSCLNEQNVRPGARVCVRVCVRSSR